MGPERVKKRDGRVVPYDARKIAAAIAKAFAATGEGDPRLAEELAQVVSMAILRLDSHGARRAARPGASWTPTIEEIQDLVERVLMETGYAKTAKAYILYRDKRAKLRELLSVRESDAADASPRVEGPRGKAQDWSKGRIAAALMQEADLPRETAEEVASRVEQKVFGSGITRLSTTLIRELVDNELFAMGLEGKRRKQTLIGIPKYDLGQILRSGIFERGGESLSVARDPVTAAARHLVERYALEEILPVEIADLHRDAEIHFPGLGAIEKEFTLALRASEIHQGSLWPGAVQDRPEFADSRWSDPDFAAQTLALLVSRARGVVSSTLVLEEVDSLASQATDVAHFWEALASRLALLREGGPEIVISGSAPAAASGGLSFLDPVSSYGEIRVGPGLERHGGETATVLACGAMGAVNCPRLAFASGPWQDSKLLESLVRAIESVVTGLRALAEFQRQARLSRDAFAAPVRVAYAISLEGIVETVRFSREGAFDPDLARTMRAVGLDLLRDLSTRHQIAFTLEERSLRESAGRFARADLDRFPQSRGLLSPDNPVYHSQLTMAESAS